MYGQLCVLVLASNCSTPWSSVVESSENAAEQLEELGQIPWSTAPTARHVWTVEHDPTTLRQTVNGFGGAFTEAAGYNYRSLSPTDRQQVLDLYFGVGGIGYTTGRVAMNSPDFALSDYSYANVSNDTLLKYFDHNLTRDNDEYVLPFLRDALTVATDTRKRTAAVQGATANYTGDETVAGAGAEDAPALKLFSAPWSPPAWMKRPFTPGGVPSMDVSAPNCLVPDARAAWALYFSLWHTAMQQQASGIGIPFWGFSVQNEPLAHGHMWDCCGYTLGNYTEFIKDCLVPVMQKDHPALKLLLFDHNPDNVEKWAGTSLNDSLIGGYAWGTAVHWYSDPVHRGAQLNATHLAHPAKPILHTEGCVCRDIPLPSEHGWWGVGEEYGVGLFQYMQNWAVGFTDWNMLLNLDGGPYHQRPFGCNAPIQANGTDGFYIQAPFYFMAHFSRYLPPGSTIVGAMVYKGVAAPVPLGRFYYAMGDEGIQPPSDTHPPTLAFLGGRLSNGTNVMQIMNTADVAIQYQLKSAQRGAANMSIPPHAIQTLRWN